MSSAYGALAQANEGLGAKEAALQARQMARLIDHDLYFTGKELRETVAMARLLVELERATRARMTIDQGLVLAKELKDAKSEEALKELAAKLK